MSDRRYREELQQERRLKDEFMATHPESPFVDSGTPGFAGLRYFPIKPAYRVAARLERIDPPQPAYLRTNRDNQAEMRYLGDLVFSIGRRKHRLRVYHATGSASTSVFIPFRDRTSGQESYGPGRYLTLDLTEDDRYELDFNRAFNPYCAYTDGFECGFPPPENDLSFRVPAGEKVWDAGKNPATPEAAVRERVSAALARQGPSQTAPARRRARPSSDRLRRTGR
jgi:uncharacterized protein (DUF1684 family)